MHLYLIAFLLTLALESIVLYFLLKRNWLEIIKISFLINIITWPIANYLYAQVLSNFWLIEFFVFLAESILLFYLLKIKYFKALYVSFLINFVTAIASSIIF